MIRPWNNPSVERDDSFEPRPGRPAHGSTRVWAKGITEWLRAGWKGGWLPVVLLVVATVLAYLPVWHAGFIWDDDAHVTKNLTLRSLEGLRRIWLRREPRRNTIPLVHTSFWLEWRLWGANPWATIWSMCSCTR